MEALLPKRLNKYYLIGQKDQLDQVLKRLQDIGAFHINYVDSSLKLGTFKSDIVADVVLKNKLTAFLDLNDKFAFDSKHSLKLDKKALGRIIAVASEIKTAEKELKRYAEEREKLNVLWALGVTDLNLLRYRQKISLLRSKHHEKIEAIRKVTLGGYWFYLVEPKVLKTNFHVEEMNLEPLFQYGYEKTSDAISTVNHKDSIAKRRYMELRKRYKFLFENYAFPLKSLIAEISDGLIRKRSIRKIADEGRVFVISCFLPADLNLNGIDIGAIKKIRTDFSPSEAPTIKPSGRVIGGFSLLTWLYGTPKYNEIDPSVAISITFPLLFGAIVGDLGYGLVLLVGSIFLYFYNTTFKKSLFWIFVVSALSSMAFGMLFGEFFGNLIPIHPLLFYRLQNLGSLLFGSVFAGSVILTFSFIFNEIDAFLENNNKRLIGGAGWLLLDAFILYEIVQIYFYASLNVYAAVLIPIAAAFIGVGNKYEISQVLNLFTNVVSYLRIAAVGLSSIMLAMLINELGAFLVGYSVIFAILVLAVFHLANILLDSLIAFLQSLRLEYVEFLSKFFNGGGVDYEPLEHAHTK